MSLLFGDFAYDQERRQLLRAGHPVRIEPKAYELLGLLLERRPRALSKAQIRDVLWPGTFVSESALARLITDLRATLEDDVRQPRFIRTVHGFGYAFCGQALLATEQLRIETAGSETVARSPYPGLSSFMEADASRFFGREGEVQALLEKIRRQKLLAVIGPSGVGKTSFMRAGVVASLPSEWGALVVTPRERPFAALAQAVSRELAGDADALAELIQGIAEQGHDLKRVLTAVSCWRKKHGEALLVVDQFEELFAQNPQEVQARFASLLGAIAAEADVHVVVSIRDDFLFRCSEHESLLPLFDALTPLRLPSKDALVRAVMEPAAKEGLGFEDEALVEEMVQAVVTERGALPLLAFAVSRLWEQRDRERKLLTRAAYREIGGVEGALAQHAEATLEIIGPGREGIVREVFRNLSTSQGTRAVLGHEELLSAFADRAAAEVVLRQLVGARLLTSYETESGDGIPSRHAVEIVHESLLRAWSRLVRWQTQDADGAQFRDQLRQTARLWDERGRAEDLLWTGASYLDYRAWRARYPGGLSSVEEAFAHAMAALADRRRRRRRIAITAAFAMLAIGLGVLGTLWRRSETSRRTAAAEALRAEAAKLLALGRLQLDEYPTAALAYATKSLELADNQEARRFAVEALWRGPTAFILQPVPSGQWRMVAFSPDGKWLAASSFDAEVVVWPSSGGEPLVLGGHERAGAYRRLAFGPHSDLLVTKSEAADPLRIWSIPQGQLLRKMEFEEHTAFLLRGDRLLTFTSSPPAGSSLVGRTAGWRSWPLREGPGEDLGRVPQTSVTDPDVDPDAKWVAMARRRSVVIRPLERLRTGEERLVGMHPGNVTGIAFGPDRRLVSRDDKGEIRFWSLDSHDARPFRVLSAPPAAVTEGAWFDRTGSRAIAGFQKERLVRVWDMTGPPESEPLVLRRGDAIRVELVDTTPDGRWLAVGNENSVSLWPVAIQYPRILKAHADRIWQLRFAPDGQWIASGSWDGTAKIWPLDQHAGRASWTTLQNGGAIYGLAVDSSGSHVLTAEAGGRILVRKPFQDTPPFRLEPEVFAPVGATFDRQGRRAAVGAVYSPSVEGSVIRVWDVETGHLLKALDLLGGTHTSEAPGYAGGVHDLEFAPDGQLYSAGYGGVRRWDVERGTNEAVVQGTWIVMDLSDDGRHLLTATSAGQPEVPSAVDFHDIHDRTSRRLASHGAQVVAVALDPTAKIAVTGSSDGVVRVGPVTGEEPYLLYGHKGAIYAVAVSPDGRWIASGGQDGTLRLWPMPDSSRPPLHTLPYQELLAKLKTMTNLRIVGDKTSPTGYKLDVSPFLGWVTAPTW